MGGSGSHSKDIIPVMSFLGIHDRKSAGAFLGEFAKEICFYRTADIHVLSVVVWLNVILLNCTLLRINLIYLVFVCILDL